MKVFSIYSRSFGCLSQGGIFPLLYKAVKNPPFFNSSYNATNTNTKTQGYQRYSKNTRFLRTFSAQNTNLRRSRL